MERRGVVCLDGGVTHMVINDCLIGVNMCMRFLDRGWIGLGWRS